MTTLYKLTTQDNKTRKGYHNETTWGAGVTHSGTGEGDLCGPGFIHAYTDPLLAVLLNPIQAGIADPKLWVCEGEVVKTDHGLKVGCVALTTVSVQTLPIVTTEQRVKFAVLCAKRVCDDPAFVRWAAAWLDGTNRTKAAAAAAAEAAWAAWAAAEAARAAERSLDLIPLAHKAMEES